MLGNAYWVYLKFGEAKGPLPLERLQTLARQWFPWAASRGVVVDNSLKGDLERQLAPDVTLLSGDNREREFTGYQKGLEWLERHYSPGESTPVILANDTFLASYGGGDFLRDFTFARVQAGLALGALVGHVDRFPEPVEFEGRAFQSWVRTSLVVAQYKTWRALLPLPLSTPSERIFSQGEEFFAPSAPLNETYREFLETWLMRDPSPTSPFKESWHSKEPLTNASRKRLREKARCILSEQTLSLRAAEAGIRILDPKRLSLPGPKRIFSRLRHLEWGGRA